MEGNDSYYAGLVSDDILSSLLYTPAFNVSCFWAFVLGCNYLSSSWALPTYSYNLWHKQTIVSWLQRSMASTLHKQTIVSCDDNNLCHQFDTSRLYYHVVTMIYGINSTQTENSITCWLRSMAQTQHIVCLCQVDVIDYCNYMLLAKKNFMPKKKLRVQ